MKIWIGHAEDICATTGCIKYPGNKREFTCDDSDAMPFLFSQFTREILVGSPGEIHWDIWQNRAGSDFGTNFIAGRLWLNGEILTFYHEASNPFPGSEDLAEIANKLRKLGVNIQNYTLIKQIGRLPNYIYVMVEIPVSEYINGSFDGFESYDDFKSICRPRDIIDMRLPETERMLSQTGTPSKVNKFPGDDEYSKLQNMRQWNGYSDVTESKMKKKVIVSESQLRVILNEIASVEIDERTKDVDLTPTDAQKEASNYRMAHFFVKGMKIAIENPKGSKRYYTDEKTGEKKYVVMNNHYGYFNITKGKDGDAVDVFIGPDIDNFENVYCVDQNNKKGEFDETKVMLGFTSKEQAKAAYMSNYSPGWTGFRAITGVSLKHFKKWLYRGRKQRQPFADYVYVQKKKIEEARVIGNQAQNQLFYKYVEKAKFYIDFYEKHSEDYNTNFIVWQIDDGKYNESFYIKAVKRALDELQASGMTLQYYKFTTKAYARKKPAE